MRIFTYKKTSERYVSARRLLTISPVLQQGKPEGVCNFILIVFFKKASKNFKKIWS